MLDVDAYGRFLACAWPWVSIGANCLPIAPGGKSPTVAGWGARGPNAHKMSLRLGFGPHPLHSAESPKLPPDEYARLAAAHRDCNALIFPATIGAMVVDVDNPELLDAVLAVCGPTPYRTMSGRVGGGIHLWYGEVTKGRNGIAPKVDLKSTGGYVLAPGSIHPKTGQPYTASPELAAYLDAGQRPPFPKPRAGWRKALQALGSQLTRPTRIDLHALADKLSARNQTRTWGRLLRLVAEGKPFAGDGERDGALFRLLAVLADEWPKAETTAIQTLFAASAAAMEAEHPVDIPILEAIEAKWDRLTHDAAYAEDEADLRTCALRRTAWQWVRVDSEEAVERGHVPLVAHHGKSYFVRVGSYWAGPWTRDELTPDVLGSLRAVYGVEITDVPGLLAAFGTRAATLELSLSARHTTYDPATGRVEVACAPIRSDLTPAYSPAVEAIIREIGGEYAGQLMWWLAGILRSDVPARALILSGKRQRGKSLLLDGIARLWPDGAAKMRDVLGKRFNSQIASSGFAVADDDTSASESGEALATFLREAVHDRMQRLERKHHDVMKLRGCMRYAVATNDAFALVQGAVSYNLNNDALEAFGDRLLHVPVPASAAGCWERAGVTGEQLVAGDMIARHVLWLSAAAADAVPPDRFWVGPGDTSLGRLAAVSSGLRGDVLVRLAGELEAGRVAKTGTVLGGTSGLSAYVADAGDCVHVHASGLYDQWGQDRPRGATVRTVGLAISALSRASICDQPNYQGGKVIKAIDKEIIFWYSKLTGI